MGVIIYECLSGVFPFDDSTSIENQVKNMDHLFPKLSWDEISVEGIFTFFISLMKN